MGRKKLTESEKFIIKLRKVREHDQMLLDSDYKSIIKKNIPAPSHLYEPGDRVDYGNWNYTEVLEMCNGGKFYKCHSCTVNENTNQGRVFNEKVHYEPWYSLGIYRTMEEYGEIDRLEEDRDIRFNYSQRSMSHLFHLMFIDYGIDLDPDYQRGNIWTLDQKVNLIDSIFKNVDIGKFTIISRPWGSNPNKAATPKMWEMLDGKQRITAIIEFYTNRFKYKGKYFCDMHIRDKQHFKNYNISSGETEPLTDEQKYRYFLKLNTTGTPVDEAHIAKVRKLWLDSKKKQK